MESAVKVASCILNEMESLTTMKLQKLVYYSQALYLVEFGTPLFQDEIQAWANGPVVRSLFDRHKGMFLVRSGYFGADTMADLPDSERTVVATVIEKLGDLTGAQLSELTHGEQPWLEARRGLAPRERSSNVITPKSMLRFYASPDCGNPLFRASA